MKSETVYKGDYSISNYGHTHSEELRVRTSAYEFWEGTIQLITGRTGVSRNSAGKDRE